MPTKLIELHIGFTGSRIGMSLNQRKTFSKICSKFSGFRVIFHHGDCIGSDEEACAIASKHGWRLHSHPGKTGSKRAFVQSDIIEIPLAPLIRNRRVVDSVKLLVACPSSFEEILRSGTWSTIRYARGVRCPRVIVWPDGKVLHEREYENLQLR